MDLRLRPSRTFRARAGFTLVELVVAILLAGVIAAAVFSVALTSQTGGGGKAGRKLMAAMATKQVTTQLGRYVSGCCSIVTGSCSNCGSVSGPNACAGADSWSMTNPCADSASAAGVVDTGPAPAAYALSVGKHVLTGVLPASLEGAPYNARVSYTVTAANPISNCGWTGNTCYAPAISVSADWTEP